MLCNIIQNSHLTRMDFVSLLDGVADNFSHLVTFTIMKHLVVGVLFKKKYFKTCQLLKVVLEAGHG